MSSAPPTRKLTRTRRHKMIAGVCGGLAEYFELDPTVVRVASKVFPLWPVLFVDVLRIVTVVLPQVSLAVGTSKFQALVHSTVLLAVQTMVGEV